MIDRIVVVDSGQVIETNESAIIAKDEADRAEKWAKYSEEQANLASNNAIAAAASKEAAAQSAQSAANTVNGFDAHAADKQQDFDDNYTSKLNSFNTNASEKQAQVDASAETARKWAIGTISEQPQGSAKYWAEQAKTATAGTLNESILTNCLTEIPQDIKLELSNGTLTLKAGGKVYNGDGTFYTNSSDISVTPSWGTVSGLFVFSVISGNSIVGFDATNANLVFSGDTAPTFAGNYAYWYDTTVKKVKYTSDAGSSWKENRAFPLCLVTASSGVVTSIDQVFNGFGYIDNTIFALPSIKGLIPNGFNTDGSLNSTEFTTTSVLTYSYINANSGVLIGINANSLASDKYVYNKDENYNRNPQGVIAPRAMFAKVSTDSTGRVTSFNPNTAFHATDYNEFARALETKQDVISLIANRALVSDTSGNIAVSAVTSTELGYLDGVTSNIQTQINNCAKIDSVFIAEHIGQTGYTSRTDVPEGRAWADGAEYTQAVFPDVYNLLVNSKLRKTTYSDFNSKVSANGFCDYFALDTTNKKFKVPKLLDKFVMDVDNSVPVKGDGTTLGLTDGNGEYNLTMVNGYVATANNLGVDVGVSSTANGNNNRKVTGLVTDSSKSGIIADITSAKSTAVLKAYVVLYATAVPASTAQASEFMTALGSKANTDLSNISTAGKETAVTWGMPNYAAGVSVSFPLSASKFTAPLKGIYMVNAKWAGNNNGANAFVNGTKIASGGNTQAGTAYVDNGSSVFIPLDKGDILYFDQACRAVRLSMFYPMKGV